MDNHAEFKRILFALGAHLLWGILPIVGDSFTVLAHL